MTHAVPRPRKPSARTTTGRPRHPANSGRTSTGGADRLLGSHAVPESQPTLPKRKPGIALDAVHENSVIPLRDLDGTNEKSERWFTPRQKHKGNPTVVPREA